MSKITDYLTNFSARELHNTVEIPGVSRVTTGITDPLDPYSADF